METKPNNTGEPKSNTPGNPNIPLTRRDLLRVLPVVVGGALWGGSGLLRNPGRSFPVVPGSTPGPIVFDNEPVAGDVDLDTPYNYSGEIGSRIDAFKVETGISIVCPKTTEHGTKKNIAWQAPEIDFVMKTLKEDVVPASLTCSQAPSRVVLLRSKGFNGLNGGLGGHYTGGSSVGIKTVELFSDEGFNLTKLTDTLFDRKLWNTQADLLRAVVTTELIHGIQASDHAMVVDYINKTGWYQKPDKSWANHDPATLGNYGDSNDNPVEDMGFWGMVLTANYRILPENRMKFFMSTPYFANWKYISQYKAERGIAG